MRCPMSPMSLFNGPFSLRQRCKNDNKIDNIVIHSYPLVIKHCYGKHSYGKPPSCFDDFPRRPCAPWPCSSNDGRPWRRTSGWSGGALIHGFAPKHTVNWWVMMGFTSQKHASAWDLVLPTKHIQHVIELPCNGDITCWIGWWLEILVHLPSEHGNMILQFLINLPWFSIIHDLPSISIIFQLPNSQQPLWSLVSGAATAQDLSSHLAMSRHVHGKLKDAEGWRCGTGESLGTIWRVQGGVHVR